MHQVAFGACKRYNITKDTKKWTSHGFFLPKAGSANTYVCQTRAIQQDTCMAISLKAKRTKSPKAKRM